VDWVAKGLLRELLSCADRRGLRYEIATAQATSSPCSC